MRLLVLLLLVLGGCAQPPQTMAPREPEASKAFVTRSFYVFMAERNDLSVDHFAARATLVTAPEPAPADRCFRYHVRVDWAFVPEEACFRGASKGRLGRFAYGGPLREDQRLALRTVPEIVAKFDEARCGSMGGNVEYGVERDGKLVLLSNLAVGDPGYCTVSLLTGEISIFNDWSYPSPSDARSDR